MSCLTMSSTDLLPDAVAQLSEYVGRHHLVGARARQRDRNAVDDPSGPRRHHQHFVGQVDRLGQAVGDEHDGLARGRPDAQQLVAHGHARLLVERGERLVHQQHRRVLDQAAGDGDALLHAARKLVRIARAEAVEAHKREHGFGAPSALLAWGAAQAEREFDVVERREPRKQARLLEDHADALWIGIGNRAPVAQDLAFGLGPQSGQHHQQRSLAAAARADDHHEAADADGHGNVFQRRHAALQARIDVAEIRDLDRDLVGPFVQAG